jgi:hypothetical protein
MARAASGTCLWRLIVIDRACRFVHLTVKDDETTASAVAFLAEAVVAFPFQVTHVLTDRGSCFTADGFEAACRKLGVEHRKTRPYTPKTNGMKPMAWWSASTGVCRARCWASRFPATATWKPYCEASTKPTMAQAYNGPSLQWPTPACPKGAIPRHGRA